MMLANSAYLDQCVPKEQSNQALHSLHIQVVQMC